MVVNSDLAWGKRHFFLTMLTGRNKLVVMCFLLLFRHNIKIQDFLLSSSSSSQPNTSPSRQKSDFVCVADWRSLTVVQERHRAEDAVRKKI